LNKHFKKVHSNIYNNKYIPSSIIKFNKIKKIKKNKIKKEKENIIFFYKIKNTFNLII